jgi:hypothetical protein
MAHPRAPGTLAGLKKSKREADHSLQRTDTMDLRDAMLKHRETERSAAEQL